MVKQIYILMVLLAALTVSQNAQAEEGGNSVFSDYIYGVCLNPVSGEAILNGFDCKEAEGYVMLSKNKGYRRIANSGTNSVSYEFAHITIPYDSVSLEDIKGVPESEWSVVGNTVGYSYGASTTVFRHTNKAIYGKAMLIPSEWTSLGIFQITRADGEDSWQLYKNRYSKAVIDQIN